MNPKNEGQGREQSEGGPPPGGQKGGKQENKEQTPPDDAPDIQNYDGKQAFIHGKIMGAPPEGSPFGDIDGLIFPDLIIIEGKEVQL